MRKLFLVIAGLALFLAVGCTTVPPQVAFDRTTANIQSIAVIDPAFPERIAAGEYSGDASLIGGAAGGFLGALLLGGIEASAYESRQNKLDALNEGAFDGKAVLSSLLAEDLEALGYEARIVDDPKPKRLRFLNNLEKVNSAGSDAILDIVVSTYGFQKNDNMWAPVMITNIKMTRTNDERVLLQNVIVYNPAQEVEKAINIIPFDVPIWEDIESIAADEAAAIESVRNAVERTVVEIANQLR